MPTRSSTLATRLRRQRLTEPLENKQDYIELFRLLQPVCPVARTRPGDPPRLIPRTRFDDGAITDRLRADWALVKGRFLGGKLGYVLTDDLAIYANAFRKPLSILTDRQRIVLDAVQNVGPLTPRQIKDETQLLNKHIMPALHRLQTAFLVYEEQVDNSWERSWYDFESEWPDVELNEDLWPSAAAQVLTQFLRGHVFATLEQLKDWSRFSKVNLTRLIQGMEASGIVAPQTVDGLGDGWMLPEDIDLGDAVLGASSFMLHGADILVMSHISELKQRFSGLEVLQYLLIDGAFLGAVVGHWRIGPHDVDDIVVLLPAQERAARKDEIVSIVARAYYPPRSHILRYDGKDIYAS